MNQNPRPTPMRPTFFIAPAALQLLMVVAAFCLQSPHLPGGWFSFDVLALVPPFICYVVALISAPFLLGRHPVLRFAALVPVAMTLSITVYYFDLKLIGHFMSGQFGCDVMV